MVSARASSPRGKTGTRAGCSRTSSTAGRRRAGSNSGGIRDACLGQSWCSSLTRSHRRWAGAMAVAGRSTRLLSQRSERRGLVEQLLDRLTNDMSGRPDLSQATYKDALLASRKNGAKGQGRAHFRKGVQGPPHTWRTLFIHVNL